MNQYNTKQMKIDPVLFQHPTDKAMTEKIVKMEAFQKALQFISKNSIEKQMRIIYRSSYAQLTPRNAPIIFRILEEAAELYEVPVIPEVYMERSYNPLILLDGMEKPIIMVSNTILENLSEQELWGILASEMAAIKNGYCAIKIVEKLCKSSQAILPEIISKPLQFAFSNWHKYAQYSFDRANLIATGDFNATMRSVLTEMKEFVEEISFDDPNCDYMKQCKEFLSNEDKLTSSLRDVSSVFSEYGYYASRYIELFKFYQMEYHDLIEDYV